MDFLEVIARAKVRPGQLAEVKARAAEILGVTREDDARTLRCDWFINEDGTDFEVHEKFPDEQGLLEHSMHIMQPRTVLFRDCAYDHRSTLYGKVSQSFLDLLEERMGAVPATYSFLQGLDQAARARERMSHLGVAAHLRIRAGELDGFTKQVAEIMRLSRELDTQTLRYDWYVNDAGTECEVHEAYLGEVGLIEHNTHVMDARAVLFDKHAYDHDMTVYGEISQPLRDLFVRHAGGVHSYSFMDGLEGVAAV